MSLIYVDDLCEALVQVACRGERRGTDRESSKDARGEGVYYVTAERDVTYAEMGRLGAEAAGWAVAAIPFPKIAFLLAGLVGEVVGRQCVASRRSSISTRLARRWPRGGSPTVTRFVVNWTLHRRLRWKSDLPPRSPGIGMRDGYE